MNIIEYLKNDEELKEYREKWRMAFGTPFPPYNYDEYNGIKDYKENIKKQLSTAGQ